MSDVLFICTGNLCRSPSAELFLAQNVLRGGQPELSVASAGTQGTSEHVPKQLRNEAAVFGLDFTDHQPRRVEAEDIARSQMIIGMTRQHVREVVLLDRSSFPRAFTLRELVRRGSAAGPRKPDEDLQGWLLRVHGARRYLDLIGDSGQDDVPDPMGGPPEGYRRMLTDVQALVRNLYKLLGNSAIPA
jgi:protein-tyrosine phosphatase